MKYVTPAMVEAALEVLNNSGALWHETPSNHLLVRKMLEEAMAADPGVEQTQTAH